MEQQHINLIKQDFPEYGEIIDGLDLTNEPYREIFEDYYFCKNKVKTREKSEGHKLLKEYMDTYESLKEEIRVLLMKAVKKKET